MDAKAIFKLEYACWTRRAGLEVPLIFQRSLDTLLPHLWSEVDSV